MQALVVWALGDTSAYVLDCFKLIGPVVSPSELTALNTTDVVARAS